MRWRWIDPQSTGELRQRDEVIGRIEAWWSVFAERAADLDALFRKKQSWDLPGWMRSTLGAVNPELMWEYGCACNGDGHRLVITPEASRWLRPLVATILERAPSIRGWEFYDHRLRESLDWAIPTVEARAGFTITTASVELSVSDHRVHLRYRFPECTSEEDERATRAAFVATESLLGEDVLDAWIGAIDAVPAKRPVFSFAIRKPPPGVALQDLAAAVDAEIVKLRRSLPPVPCVELPETWQWTMWKLKPDVRKDYPAQEDLFVGKSAIPAMWLAAHRDGVFLSSCFSNHGETFCFLKIDGTEPEPIGDFADKGEIEDALEEALRQRRLGACVGGGTGLRYSYVDLALLDVERGVAVVRDILQRGRVTRRAWVLFFDDAFAREWIGVWPDSPPPPTDSCSAS